KRVERLNIYDAMEQSVRDAKDKVPVVAHRKNRKGWLITMRAEDWIELVKLYLDSVPEATVVCGEWKLYGNDDDSGMSYWCTVCNFQLSEDLFYSGYNGRWIENGVFK